MLSSFAALLFLAVPDPLAALGPVPAGTVRIYLVRHGQALSNLEPPPPPSAAPHGLDHLTPLGEAQARKVGEILAGQGVKLVLTSPAGRAKESAQQIAAALGAAPTRVETRLRPLELGRDASGQPLTWDDRAKEFAGGRDPAPAGGESMAQVGERVMALAEGLQGVAPCASMALLGRLYAVVAFLREIPGTLPARRYPPDRANG